MEKLNELEMLSKFADKEVTWSLLPFDLSKEGWCVEVVDYIAAASPATILAIAESFRALEKEVQKNLEGALAWQQRAEAAEAKLAELEKQASEQKPFMYGIMTANGDAHFEDFCVSSDPGLLEDVIWEWNNTLADNEPKNRVVPLFTRPAPAINLAELVPHEGFLEGTSDELMLTWQRGWDACRAAILRNIEEAK